MDVTYRPISPEDFERVRQLLTDVGWGARVQDQNRFAQMMRGATRTVVAFDGDRVVGFGRALTDGASNGYISTLAVASDCRRLGIGTELVRRLMDVQVPPGQLTWVLRAGHGSEEFWGRLGFTRSDCAMELPRRY
jgi:ribosomal protein S18 acetylase RimI-like enzyme